MRPCGAAALLSLSPAVLALLGHLESVGFSASPLVVSSGLAEDGRETLGVVAGASPQPGPRCDQEVFGTGRPLRQPQPRPHWLNAQLHDDDVVETNGLGSAAARARRLRLILDGFGLPRDLRGGVRGHRDRIRRPARSQAMVAAVTPQSPAVDATGYPVL